jgi:HEAT repeat protein
MAHINRLAIFMERIKEVGIDILPELLKQISQGRVELIQVSLSQIRPLADYLKKHQQARGYRAIIQDITPFLTELVDHEEPDIRDMARSKLGEIAELMTEEDRSNYVLKVCLELVQEQQRDQNKIAGLKLLGQLAGLFQKEFVQGFVVTQLTALSHDANDNVRVQTVEQMAKICTYIDKDVITRKFAPEFKRLSQDQNWQVRLNFVEKLVILAEHMPIEKRNSALGEILFNLLNDKTRWVKEAALQQLGHYLAILDQKYKNDKLFEEYLKIPKSIAKFTKEPQTKICLSVAETLPKIIEAQGESTWKPLSQLYKLLLEKDEEIKIILAKNIHSLSRCLTKSENKNMLLAVMKKEFLSNNVKGSPL